MSSSYSVSGSILEKCGNFWKNSHFSGRIWRDSGNTKWVDMVGLGSKGLSHLCHLTKLNIIYPKLTSVK